MTGDDKGNRRFGGRRAVLRVLAAWLLTAGAILLLGAILAGFRVDGDGAALAAAALIGLINALVWPLLIRLALPFTVLTMGLGVLALNGAVVLGVAAVDSGIHVSGVGTGIAVALGITIVNTLVTSLLAIDDEDFYYRNVIKRQAKRHAAASAGSKVPGVYFLEIDGLAHGVVRRALRDGHVPTLGRWLREGTHSLARWETDWSSQTGACQAGLLHGDNDDMPAFRWWEKERDAAIVTNHPPRRGGDRASPFGWARPAARGRGEPRQHPLRRRPPHAADDEHRARPRPSGAHRAGLLRLLRQPPTALRER